MQHQNHNKTSRSLRLRSAMQGCVAAVRPRCMRGCARLLMVAYTLLMLKPAMPVIMDKLAHTFWENVHVAVVHKVNGKEHVHYELRKAINDAGKEKSGISSKWLADDAPCITVKYSVPLPGFNAGHTAAISFQRHHSYKDAGLARDFPPPKA